MSTETRTLEEMQARVFERGKQPAQPAGDSAAARLIADDQARREKERLQRRADLRKQIAERSKLMARVTDLEAELRALDARCDDLAVEHARKCEPLQAKLQAASAAARTKLLAEVTVFNCELEEALQAVRRVRSKVVREHRDVRSAAAGLPTEQQLSGGDLAAPELRCELFVTKQRLAASEQRISRARDWVSAFDRQLSLASSTPARPMMFGWHAEHGKVALDFDRINLLEFRLSKWRAELLDAEHERHECLSEMQRISTEMIAE